MISGGRPKLSQRPTRLLLSALAGMTADPVWMVREDRAGEYEQDGFEVATFSVGEAEEYAAAHWTGIDPFEPGGFTGAFCEREWACRLAESRGYWAVLQLDDNIIRLRVIAGMHPSDRLTREAGGLGLFADLLAAVTLATNSRMTGAALDAVQPQTQVNVFARPGFPYSLFLERVGPGREPWYGPAEDDILHAWQYASGPEPVTAALVPPLHYIKEPKSAGGMRDYYRTNKRAVGLQRVAPEMASISVHHAKANGRATRRVFHHMRPGVMAKQAPLIITDPVLYRAAKARARELAAEMLRGHLADVEAKVNRRAERASRAGV